MAWRTVPQKSYELTFVSKCNFPPISDVAVQIAVHQQMPIENPKSHPSSSSTSHSRTYKHKYRPTNLYNAKITINRKLFIVLVSRVLIIPIQISIFVCETYWLLHSGSESPREWRAALRTTGTAAHICWEVPHVYLFEMPLDTVGTSTAKSSAAAAGAKPPKRASSRLSSLAEYSCTADDSHFRVRLQSLFGQIEKEFEALYLENLNCKHIYL